MNSKTTRTIGYEDRQHSYFLRIFLASYRAGEYLSERPDCIRAVWSAGVRKQK